MASKILVRGCCSPSSCLPFYMFYKKHPRHMRRQYVSKAAGAAGPIEDRALTSRRTHRLINQEK